MKEMNTDYLMETNVSILIPKFTSEISKYLINESLKNDIIFGIFENHDIEDGVNWGASALYCDKIDFDSQEAHIKVLNNSYEKTLKGLMEEDKVRFLLNTLTPKIIIR